MKYLTKSIQVNIRQAIQRMVPPRAGKRQKDPRYRQALLDRRENEVRKEMKEIQNRPFILESDDARLRKLGKELSRLSRSPVFTT